MGRKKIPPPEQKFFLGDRVSINNRNFEEETGVITYIELTGAGSYQEWNYYVTTHRRWCIYKNNRISIRCYTRALTLLTRKKNYWTKDPAPIPLTKVLPFKGFSRSK